MLGDVVADGVVEQVLREAFQQQWVAGLGNWTGLAALVIVVVLFALSTDGALRELKARTWMDLQRLNYTLFALVFLHAFFYRALLRMTSPFTRLLLFTVIGVWLWRRRSSRAGGTLAHPPS